MENKEAGKLLLPVRIWVMTERSIPRVRRATGNAVVCMLSQQVSNVRHDRSRRISRLRAHEH